MSCHKSVRNTNCNRLQVWGKTHELNTTLLTTTKLLVQPCVNKNGAGFILNVNAAFQCIFNNNICWSIGVFSK